jgi:RNA polymerase sigma-70 factor (ECF subfamily)
LVKASTITPDRQTLATRTELSDFLASVERRAFRQAQFALRNEDAALDVLQEAMLKLADKYSHKPLEELPMLFQRILQNAVRDYMRRAKVRNFWVSLLATLSPREEDEADALDNVASADAGFLPDKPDARLEQAQLLALIEKEIDRLPPRQREAFLMRYWEELDIAETAAAMGCSEGSVKTHCSRATSTLAEALKARGIKP